MGNSPSKKTANTETEFKQSSASETKSENKGDSKSSQSALAKQGILSRSSYANLINVIKYNYPAEFKERLAAASKADLESLNSLGDTVLLVVAESPGKNSDEMLQLMLQQNINIFALNSYTRRNFLHHILCMTWRHNSSDFIKLQKRKWRVIIALVAQAEESVKEHFKMLLEMQDIEGNTPLHLICQSHCVSSHFVKLVLELYRVCDANVNVVNRHGRIPLHEISFFSRKKRNYLLAFGADRNRVVAIVKHDFFYELAARGDMYGLVKKIKETKMSTAEIRSVLERKDEYGNTPLHVAIDKMIETQLFLGLVELYYMCEADIDIRNHDGYTPLLLAIINMRSFNYMYPLLEDGADCYTPKPINLIRNNTGEYPHRKNLVPVSVDIISKRDSDRYIKRRFLSEYQATPTHPKNVERKRMRDEVLSKRIYRGRA